MARTKLGAEITKNLLGDYDFFVTNLTGVNGNSSKAQKIDIHSY